MLFQVRCEDWNNTIHIVPDFIYFGSNIHQWESQYTIMKGNISLVMGNKTKDRWCSKQDQDAIKRNPYPEDIRHHWPH